MTNLNFTPDTVKGFQDFLPPVSLKREAVQKIIEKWFKLYGFSPIETPVVEYDELMRPDSQNDEDQAISDRFKLQDKAKRNLGLRYEFTFQLQRILKQNPNIKLPFKRYQIGPVFRDEPVTANRFRQLTQCDIDTIGDSSISADSECVAAFADILKELKIPFEIQVNNRKLLNSIIESVQISKPQQVMRELDKLDKIGEDEVKANLRKIATPNQILTLFKLLGKDLNFFKKNAFEGIDELEELVEECSFYGIKLKFNINMIRGLSYYTGNIFEAISPGKKDSLGGGGRYDKSVGKYSNKEIPAVGFSFGLERVTQLANIQPEPLPKAIVISFDQTKPGIQLTQTLRKNNISCTLAQGQPTKALEFANSYSIPYAIFLGQDEVEKSKFKLKDLTSGDEKLLSEKQLIKALQK